MEIRLRRPQQFRNPGAFQSADYREREGWSGVAGITDLTRVKKVGEGGIPFVRALYRWREKIRRAILIHLEGTPAALLMALIIGETGYLTDEIREVFSASGTTHILSISGSHLALVSFLIFGASRWLILHLPSPLLLRISLWKVPSQWAALVTAGPVIFYAFLAGGEVATLRSLTMILVYLFSIWINRSGDIKISLAFAALLIVLFHPQSVFDVSFQLSFLSVLSIALVIEWWGAAFSSLPSEMPLSRFQKYVAGPGKRMLLSTIGATLGSAPLTLYYFHQFSWVGLIANFIIVPLAGWVIIPFGLISSVAALFLDEGFPFSAWHQWLGMIYYRVTAFFAGFPGADFHFSSPPLLMVLLFYGVIFSLLARQASWKRLLPVTLVFFLFFLGWEGIRRHPEMLRVTFIDVGQGDATLIEFPRGKTMLVDGGSGGLFNIGKIAVTPYLQERRIGRIDYLVGTHPQMDHMGGLAYIVRKFSVGEVWTDGMTREVPFYRDFLTALDQKGLSSRKITRSVPPMEIDGCRVDFFNPSEGADLNEKTLNNQSVVLRLSCPAFGKGGVSFLLTGDIEMKGEEAILEKKVFLKSTFLKVPHHGSRTSSGKEFLSTVSPEVALFSVGAHNSYRHPHPEVLAAYEASGIKIYRTDRDGALIVEADAGGEIPRIRSYREGAVDKIKWDDFPGAEWKNITKVFQFPK
jgi:competence protein ComEC